MATYRSHSAAAYTWPSPNSNLEVTKPSGTAEGDELIAVFHIGADTVALIPSVTFPSGWTTVSGPNTVSDTNNSGNYSIRSWLLRKRATGSEPSSYTFTHSSALAGVCIAAVQDAGDDATPTFSYNAYLGNLGGTTYATTIWTGVTTSANDAWVGAFGVDWNGGALSPPSGTAPTFTERSDTADVLYFAEGTWSSSGATGDKTQTNSNSTQEQPWMAYLIALENPGGGGSAPSITDAGDETYTNGETGIVIDGADFGASQGAGTVKICPTDDVNDANAVTQTITAWGDSQVTFTAVRSTLAVNTTCYLFVVNDDGLSNVAGYPVQIASDAPRPISLRPYLPLLVR
jgi:hypothetical protein